MRALLPLAMINGNLLPSGYDQEVIFEVGYWSYAFYPQMLGAYLSAALMWVARLLGSDANHIYMAGRLASVVFGLVTLHCGARLVGAAMLAKQPKAVSRARTFECVFIILMGFWPQFAFLSSYMNNDIIALCGSAVCLFALYLGMSNGWNAKRCLLLSSGIIVSALSYWNVYGFILISIVLFLASISAQPLKRGSRMRLILLTVAACAVCTFPFFIVNLVRYGDVTGMKAFHDRYMLWVAQTGDLRQFPYTAGVKSWLLNDGYVSGTITSFVGNLGYCTFPLPFIEVCFYLLIISMGVGCAVARWRDIAVHAWAKWYVAAVTVACFITVTLFLYYNVKVDLQPQGRYVIYLLLPLMVAGVLGFGAATSDLGRLGQIAIILMCCIVVALCLHFFRNAALVTGWHGVTELKAAVYSEILAN